MKRKGKVVLCIMIAFLLSISALPISAAANTPAEAPTVSTREARILYAMVDTANASILIAVRIAQLTPYDDVDLLLCTVDSIISGVTAYAESIGAELACEYTEYVIDGRTVLIDPLRVVNIPGSGGGSPKPNKP